MIASVFKFLFSISGFEFLLSIFGTVVSIISYIKIGSVEKAIKETKNKITKKEKINELLKKCRNVKLKIEEAQKNQKIDSQLSVELDLISKGIVRCQLESYKKINLKNEEREFLRNPENFDRYSNNYSDRGIKYIIKAINTVIDVCEEILKYE